MPTNTATQHGDIWTAATWGGTPFANGNRIVQGAFNITVNAPAVIGDSPNDTTTDVVTFGTGTFTVNSDVVVRGNTTGTGDFGGACSFVLSPGASWTHDNTASGGNPTYKNTFTFYRVKLEAGSSFGAVAGTFCELNGVTLYSAAGARAVDWVGCAFDGVNFAVSVHANSGVLMRDCPGVRCGRLAFSCNASLALGFEMADNYPWTESTHATESLFLDLTAAPAGSPALVGNGFDKDLVIAQAFGGRVTGNVIGGKWVKSNDAVITEFHDNAVLGCGSVENQDGQFTNVDVYRSFFFAPVNTNPHFIHVHADTRNCRFEQNVCQAEGTVSIDSGDFVFPYSSGGFKVYVRNNQVLKASNEPSGFSSAQLGTLLNNFPARLSVWERNTGHCHHFNELGLLNVAEFDPGVTGEVEKFRWNLAYGPPGTTGVLLCRVSGTVAGIVVAAGATKNWRYNIEAGNNGRGYHDNQAPASALSLWSADAADGTNAADAGADDDQGSGDPDFLDDTRSLQSWNLDRGHGAATEAAARTTLLNNPTLVRDLVDYFHEGRKPRNPLCRTFAGDGGSVGSSNFDAGRSLGALTTVTAALGAKYGITV